MNQIALIYSTQGRKAAQGYVMDMYNRLGNLEKVAYHCGVSKGVMPYWLRKLNLRVASVMILDNEPTVIETVYTPSETAPQGDEYWQSLPPVPEAEEASVIMWNIGASPS
jgi:hypothetical protein